MANIRARVDGRVFVAARGVVSYSVDDAPEGLRGALSRWAGSPHDKGGTSQLRVLWPG